MSLTHHDGIAVYGSGLAIGKKNAESYVGPSGVDGLPRFDTGFISTSGGALAVSTRLSSIVFAAVQLGGAGRLSGLVNGNVVFSGNCLDIYTQTGAGTASASGLVYWLAFGK